MARVELRWCCMALVRDTDMNLVQCAVSSILSACGRPFNHVARPLHPDWIPDQLDMLDA